MFQNFVRLFFLREIKDDVFIRSFMFPDADTSYPQIFSRSGYSSVFCYFYAFHAFLCFVNYCAVFHFFCYEFFLFIVCFSMELLPFCTSFSIGCLIFFHNVFLEFFSPHNSCLCIIPGACLLAGKKGVKAIFLGRLFLCIIISCNSFCFCVESSICFIYLLRQSGFRFVCVCVMVYVIIISMSVCFSFLCIPRHPFTPSSPSPCLSLFRYGWNIS